MTAFADTTDKSAEGKDVWEETAKVYARLAEGPSNAAATKLLARANELLPFSSATSIHDNGCGPGMIISQLFEQYGDQIPATASLLSSDFSAAMLSGLIKKRGAKVAGGDQLWTRLQTAELDAHKLNGISDESVSHSLGGLLYMLLGNPREALRQSRRVLKSDGILALSCWKESQWMSMVDVINHIDPNKTWPFLPAEWTSVDGVKGELDAVGFSDIGAEEVEVELPFDRYEEVLDFFGHKLPHMVEARKYFNAEQTVELDRKLDEYIRNICPSLPAKMKGTAIVAWARK